MTSQCRPSFRSGAPKRRYWYLGEVFRQRRDGGSEFLQAGIEDLGDGDQAEADARILADALAVAAIGGQPVMATIGDQAVFEAVTAALGLPAGWRRRLSRAFGVPGQIEAALAALGEKRATDHDGVTAALIDAGDEPALAAEIARQMGAAGLSPTVGRSPSEIAHRALERAALAKVRLDPGALATLKDFLAIHAPLSRAPAALSAFAIRSGLMLDRALSRFNARVDAIAREGLDATAIGYDAAFGRPLDYYTGLVFEVTAPGADKPLAGGGRYDGLLTLLGATAPVPGVGFSVWLDRLDAAGGQPWA